MNYKIVIKSNSLLAIDLCGLSQFDIGPKPFDSITMTSYSKFGYVIIELISLAYWGEGADLIESHSYSHEFLD